MVRPSRYCPRWLSREQAAAYGGVSTATFDKEVSDGIRPCVVTETLHSQ